MTTDINTKLPILFRMAEIENAEGNKIGMEVGMTREQILIAVFQHKFGKENVNDDIPTTEHGVDVIVHNIPLKISWNADSQRATMFKESFEHDCEFFIFIISGVVKEDFVIFHYQRKKVF